MKTIGMSLAGGLLLGFVAAYIAHVPLTFGQITILVASGILFLCRDLFKRSGSKVGQLKSETLDSRRHQHQFDSVSAHLAAVVGVHRAGRQVAA
jgi:hypothetical protein